MMCKFVRCCLYIYNGHSFNIDSKDIKNMFFPREELQKDIKKNLNDPIVSTMLCYVCFSCEWGNIWNLLIYLGTADANDSFTGHTVCIMFGTDCATVWYSERKVEREKKTEKHNDLFSWAWL